MTGWSITRAAIAAALVSVAATPALAQDDQGYGQSAGGGFASHDAVPPDATVPSSSVSEDDDTTTWRSAPPPPEEAAPAEAESLDADPQQAPGTINSFAQPEATPGFQATTGIDNRNQAASSCLAAVRARVSGGAGAARVDGIRGEWMVSGAVDDGRAFYCAIHGGAIADVEFGG
jgi:hypothetical protein